MNALERIDFIITQLQALRSEAAPVLTGTSRRAYTVEEIADELGKSPEWVRGELRNNRLAYKRIGKTPIILADDYQTWLESQQDGD